MNPKVIMLTDEVIKEYTKDNVLTEYGDINLKVLTKLEPIPKGIYDQDIFGSMFSNRCNCGNVRTPGIRCPRCGSTILTETQSFMRFARIESPVLYSSKFKIDKLIKLIKSNFYVKVDISTPGLAELPWTDMKILDICQWEYNKDENNNHHLTITDKITDFTKCSFEGLLHIIRENVPDLLEQYRSYVNQYILVTPMILRPPIIRMKGNSRVLENNSISVIYQNILYAIQEFYKSVFPTMKTEFGKAIFRGALRRLISSTLQDLSRLFNSSKENLARSMQSNRLSNSGRCTVVPDPTIGGDEVVIPRHLMYEACRAEFIKYLSDVKKISPKEAEVIYTNQSDLDEIQDLFTKYIEGDGKMDKGKHVVINRAPSLYEFSTFVCKVKLTNDYTMKLPAVICSPTGGDFDGDQYAFYCIPKEMTDMMTSVLSARNRFTYKKNHQPLFTPDSETMHGLTHATKIQVPKSIMNFDSIDDIKDYKKSHRDFKYQTLVKLNGKETTLARAMLTEMFDKDIDGYLSTLKDKHLTPKNITVLYEQLRDKPDRIERITKIQEFGFLITTLSGQTSLSVGELYLDLDKKYLDQIRAIESDNSLPDKVKEVRIRDIYKLYQSDQLKKIPEGVAQMITDSARAKINQFGDMTIQQLNVSAFKEIHVAESTLAEGLNFEDYMWHSIENRSTQDIKQLGVPQAGYLTRQFIYLASSYQFKEGTDDNNEGILIPKNRATSRTTVDGKIVEKSDSTELVRVRSIVSTKLPKNVITKDLLTNLYEFRQDSKIGMNLVTSFTEGVTQASMSLKHGGYLFLLSDMDRLYAPEDGKLEVNDTWITFIGTSGKIHKYPMCSNWITDCSDNNEYKKGALLGCRYNPMTPTEMNGLHGIISLCRATPVSGAKKFMNSKKIKSECYAMEDGVIHYKLDGDYMYITIGDQEYAYNHDCLYKFPDGAKVKKFDRICTGIFDAVSMTYKGMKKVDLYYLFRQQFVELLPIAEELIEFIFVLLTHVGDDDNVRMNSLTKNIFESESFFKSLAFADHAKTFKKVDYEGMDFIPDPITTVMLSLVLNNNIE